MDTKKQKKLSREEIAKIEIGTTEISNPQKWTLFLLFICFISIYPVIQFCVQNPLAEWKNAGTIEQNIKAYETAIEDSSLLRQFLLAPAQEVSLNIFQTGNEKVIVGKDGWLFFSGDCDYLVNPGFLRQNVMHKRLLKGVQPDPLKAILDFNRQLKMRGIQLILLPVPVKPMIYPDMLNGNRAPLQNPSFSEFKQRLEEAGISVLDLADDFTKMRNSGVEPYLKTDTHWSPEGMLLTAMKTAEAIKGQPVPVPEGIRKQISAHGDIALMLKLPDISKYFPAESVSITDYNSPIQRNSRILLLGDSFSNIYSLPAMNWGDNGGFAEALGACLGEPIDAILRNDAGAFSTRQLLANELKRGRDRLEGKQILIYEFAIRELANGDWKILDMTVGNAKESHFLCVTEEKTVSATVLAISPVPRPYSAPYKDHVMSLHLGDIDEGSEQAIVYIVSMQNNIWTPAAKLRVGDRIKIQLSPWSRMEQKFGSWNRSEFDDEELALADPAFGILTK